MASITNKILNTGTHQSSVLRIVVVGNDCGRTAQRCRAMRELQHQVTMLADQPNDSLLFGNITILDKITHRIGLPLDRHHVNRQLYQHAQQHSIDLLWVEKCLVLYPTTIRRIMRLQRHMTIVFFSEDNMCLPHNQSIYFRHCLPLYHHVFTTKSSNAGADGLPAFGARQVHFEMKTFDHHYHRPIDPTSDERKQLGGDVGFCGTYERPRATMMLSLARAGIKVRVFGNGWKKWVGKHPNLLVANHPLYGEEYIQHLCATKINLAFLRQLNGDLHTDRSVEIPACSAFMLAEDSNEHRQLYIDGKEAVFFPPNDEKALIKQVRYYLAHDDERQAIAKAGRVRLLADKRSHHDFLTRILPMVRAKNASKSLH